MFVEKGGKERDMTDRGELTEKEGRCLLSVARKTIEQKYALRALLPRHLKCIERVAYGPIDEGPFG